MNSDYIFIFIILLIILLFFLAIRYFKYLFFYLGIFTWITISIFWTIIINNKNSNLDFINILLKNIYNFFSDSKIINFLWENSEFLFIVFLFLILYKFIYYIILIKLHFLKWIFKGILSWLANKKEENE